MTDDNQIREAFIVKYALTKGIERVQVRRSKYLPIRRWQVVQTIPAGAGGSDFNYYTEGRDLFFDRESAVSAAKAMASNRIESLNKQIKKLQALENEPKWAKG